MHGFLDILVVARRGNRDAVLKEIKLTVGLGDNEFAVGGFSPGDDVLARILQTSGKTIQVAQKGGSA